MEETKELPLSSGLGIPHYAQRNGGWGSRVEFTYTSEPRDGRGMGVIQAPGWTQDPLARYRSHKFLGVNAYSG